MDRLEIIWYSICRMIRTYHVEVCLYKVYHSAAVGAMLNFKTLIDIFFQSTYGTHKSAILFFLREIPAGKAASENSNEIISYLSAYRGHGLSVHVEDNIHISGNI